MKRTASILWVSVLALCVLAARGEATKIIYRSPKELAQESSHVVLGKVVDVRSFWNETKTKIFTEARVEVEETYKGANLAEARVLQLGGIVGHVNMHVDGALRWKRNEEVLLFLEPGTAGAFNVTGFSQGKFDVERDPKTGRPFVKGADLEGIGLVAKPAGGVRAPARVPLNQFIDETLGRR
jgi:hypothetical protein